MMRRHGVVFAATCRIISVLAIFAWAILLQPLQAMAETKLDKKYDARATSLAKKNDWSAHSRIVAQWLEQSPNSARAWYHQGLLLGALNQGSAAAAYELAVTLDPSLHIARMALCVELYDQGFLMESLLCSEHIPRNEMLDQFVARTFQHPVHVSAMRDWAGAGSAEPQDAATFESAEAGIPNSTNERGQAGDQLARREAKELARLVNLRGQCAALTKAVQRIPIDSGFGAMAAQPMATRAYRVCVEYDRALKERQYYEALRGQGN